MVKSTLKFFKLSIKLSKYVMSIVTEATENTIKLLVKQLAYLYRRINCTGLDITGSAGLKY